MIALAIAQVSLRRLARDRMSLLFMVLLPALVILIVGATVRGFSTFRVGVVDLGAGRAGAELTVALRQQPDLVVQRYGTLDAARTAVARGQAATAVVLPKGMDAALRAGREVVVGVLAEPASTNQQAAAAAVSSVVAEQGARYQAAVFAARQASGTVEANLSRAQALQRSIPRAAVRSRAVDTSAQTLPEGFSYSAPTMLVLFVFLNGLAGGAAIVETRRLGMYQRMASAPVRPLAVVAGEALSYAGVSLLQSGIIVAIGALLFGVSWGNPAAAAALIGIWALVAAGAGMLSGTLFRTPEQATAIGPAVGIAFAMLGGCMWPLSIVSGIMRQVGHATPHAWAVDAWTRLLSGGGSLGSIWLQLLVLAGFALAFLLLAATRLRRALG